jgi:plastocyanin
MSQNMTGSTKAVLVLVAVIAIIIPIALGAVLISGPLPLPSSTVAPPSSSSTSTSSGTGPTGATVILPSDVGDNQQLNFSPPTLSVAAGTTITFTDQDSSAVHNIDFTGLPAGATIPGGTPSANLKNGDTYTVTLTTPGTYSYVCDYHAWMKGTITVTG